MLFEATLFAHEKHPSLIGFIVNLILDLGREIQCDLEV